MTWAAFVIELLKTLAWPTVVVLIALRFEKQFKQLFERATKLKLGPGGLDIEVPKIAPPPEQPQLPPTTSEQSSGAPPTDQKATSEQKQLPPPTKPESQEAAEVASERALLDYAPNGAIVSAWARLEAALTGSAHWLRLGGSPRPMDSLARLRDAKVILPETADSIDQLRRLRNLVAHGKADANVETAEAFVTSCENATVTVEQAARRFRLATILDELSVDNAREVYVGWSRSDAKLGDRSRVAMSAAVQMVIDEPEMQMLSDAGAYFSGAPESLRNAIQAFVSEAFDKVRMAPDGPVLKAKTDAPPSAPLRVWLSALVFEGRDWFKRRPDLQSIEFDFEDGHQVTLVDNGFRYSTPPKFDTPRR